MTEPSIQYKIHNINLVVEEIEKEPQTYFTILKEEYLNGTLQLILRRKISNLLKSGIIFKFAIPGTRFGKAILYSNDKKYYILVEAVRTGIEVYYFHQYEKVGKLYIKVLEYWQLDGKTWNNIKEEKVFFEGQVLKFI